MRKVKDEVKMSEKKKMVDDRRDVWIKMVDIIVIELMDKR